MIEDHNCEELKGYIARCSFFIGARTHATIAAYSSCVPTLVVGYSIKAKGIAQDIFGKVDNYLIPVQDITSSHQLTNSFSWMLNHQEEIRTNLSKTMLKYCNNSFFSIDKYFE